MPIKVGDTLPDTLILRLSEEGPVPTNLATYFAGRRVVLFGVPGAFTPTCHRNHLPGFLENADNIKGSGIDEIAVISVNDIHVMRAWADATKAGDTITFLSDGSAAFAHDSGLILDGKPIGMGMRLQRFAMIVNDRKITYLNVDEVPSQAVNSAAARIMQALQAA